MLDYVYPRNKVGILFLMRENSERVPKKHLQSVGVKPLFRWAIDTAVEVAWRHGVSVYAGIPQGDDELISLCGDIHLPVIVRTKASGQGETIDQVYDAPLKAACKKLFDWQLWCNACMPFMSAETYTAALMKAQITETGFQSCRVERGFVWDEAGNQVVGQRIATANTKTNPMYRLIGHAVGCCRVSEFGTAGMYHWGPWLVIDDSPEFLDVDTPADLELVRAWADHLQQQG